MKYYLIGIKGSGLSSLALILQNLGYDVQGYDDLKEEKFTEHRLKEKKIKIYFDANFTLTSDVIIIRSTSISDEHPEIKRAKEEKLKIFDYHEFLGKLTNDFKTIAVSGTHGKTTTTTMLSLLINEVIGCNYLIGDGTGYANEDNKLLVMEACEYQRHFLSYKPAISVITNVDLDHVNYYKNIEDIKDAFTNFAKQTKEALVIYGDDKEARSLNINKKIIYYGINDNNDIRAKNIEYYEKGIKFDVYEKDAFYMHLDLPIFGHHLLLNTLATISVCRYFNIDIETIKDNLKKFKSPKRRFQEVKYKSNIIIDDYAHHPKEIMVTLKAAKQKYPNKKLIAVFQPYHYDRTKAFAKEMAMALNIADTVYVLDILSSDPPEKYPGITNKLIIKHLNNGKALKVDDNIIEKTSNGVIVFMCPVEMKMCKNIFTERN